MPVVDDVTGVPKLESVLKSLEGFMKIADFIADVGRRRLFPRLCLNENSPTDIARTKDSSVGETGLGDCFCCVQGV